MKFLGIGEPRRLDTFYKLFEVQVFRLTSKWLVTWTTKVKLKPSTCLACVKGNVATKWRSSCCSCCSIRGKRLRMRSTVGRTTWCDVDIFWIIIWTTLSATKIDRLCVWTWTRKRARLVISTAWRGKILNKPRRDILYLMVQIDDGFNLSPHFRKKEPTSFPTVHKPKLKTVARQPLETQTTLLECSQAPQTTSRIPTWQLLLIALTRWNLKSKNAGF